jgi:hypothetical protein
MTPLSKEIIERAFPAGTEEDGIVSGTDIGVIFA